MTSSDVCTPRASVVMSVYNAERYLAEAIESILGQSFTDFEFLIVDDGSTDRSRAVVENYLATEPRIRFHSRENRGLAASLNELIGMARGEYLARMDADDVSLPDRFAKQVAYLDVHPEVGILGGLSLYMDVAGRPIFVPKLPLGHEEIDAANITGRSSIVHPAAMMRTKFVRHIGGYDPEYRNAEDLDLWLRAGEHGHLANLDEVLLRYRFTESGLSGGDIKAQSDMALRACRAAWARRGLPPQKMVEGHWRPTQERGSRRDYAIKWGWQAWKGGNPGTARHYFAKALRLDPLSRGAWRGLLVSALRSPR